MTIPATTSQSESQSPRSGPITRARANIAALEALDAIRESQRPPSDDQLAALRGWSGWGPMANAFEPDRTGSWAEIGERLEWLLPPADQIEARKATYSAYYTPADVTAAAWQTLQKLGFDRGRVLEPGCGAGAFLDATPDEIATDVSWLGIERDPTTAAIAAALHPDAEIITAKLQKATLPVLSVDAALGNVPFAEHAVYDPSAPAEVRSNLHNYCLWRAVKTLRPGGVAVLITSRYTLDSLDGSARQRIFDDADLLGAVRLPAKVWSTTGTTTVADILVFRRRRPGEDIRIHDRRWLDAQQVPELDTTVNTLFLHEPDLVIGQMQARGGAKYGQTLDVVFTPTPEAETWQQGLARAIDTITGEHPDREYRQWQVDASAATVLTAENSVLSDADGRPEGSLHIIDGRARVVMDGQLQPLQRKKQTRPRSKPEPGDEDRSSEQRSTPGLDDSDPDTTEDGGVAEDQEPEWEPYELTGKQLTELAALITLRDSVLAIKELERDAVDAERSAHRATRTIAMAQRERITATQLATALLTALSAEPSPTNPSASPASPGDQLDRSDDRAVTVLPSTRPWAMQTLGAAAAAIAHAIETELGAVADRDTATDRVTALDADLANRRVGLNEVYDSYRRTFGFLNRVTVSRGKPDAETGLPTQSRRRPPIMYKFRGDPGYIDTLALEDWDDEALTGTKNAIFTHRVNRAPEPVTHADNAADAIAVSLDAHNRLDLPTIAALLDITVAQVPDALGELAYLDPVTREWTERGDYLSGNVRAKLAQASAAAQEDPEQFTRNVTALRARQPRDLLPGEIFGQLGATWIPEADVAQFIRELLNPRFDIAVKREPLTATWTVLVQNKSDRSRPESRQEWGTDDRDAYSLIETECNGGVVEIKRTEKDADGNKTTYIDRDATREARNKQRQISARFSEWLWEDPDRAERLATAYNDRFNATVQREYDGKHLSVPGMDPGFVPYKSQKDMVYRAISNKAALCGHAVGGGKTTIMGMTAVKMRQLGFANKPMIVVLKSTLEDIAREIQQRIPSARLLVADEFSMSDKRSRALWAKRCATGDYDAVIITHPAFSKITMHETFQADYISQLAANYRASLTAAMSSVDADDNEEGISDRRVKQVEKLIEALEVRAEYLLDHASDNDLYFEHLGVDYLLIDEFHYFKNLQIPCHSEGFSMSASKRATDLDMKLSWLRGQRDRIATFFSGTPISNSMLELYIVQHYMMPERLEEMGLSSPDAWVRWCVEMAEVLEISPDGQTPRTKIRPYRFRNAYELLMLVNERADVRSQEQLGLILPPVTRENRPIPRTRVQEAYGDELIRRALAVKGKPPGAGGDNMLVVVSDGRKAATDPEAADLYDPAAPVKLDDVIDQIAYTYHTMRDVQFPADSRHAADSDTGVSGVFQVAFLDLGTPGEKKDKKTKEKPKPPDARTLYAKLRDGLVAEGVPRHRVRFIHDAKTDAQRVQLFRDCRDGRVSVLIASTEKGGVGVNIQDRLVDLDHIDYGWKPSNYGQREGRAVRPGNRVVALAALLDEREAAGEPVPENWPRSVHLRNFLTTHSTDQFIAGKLVLKSGWIQQMFGSIIVPELRMIEDTTDVVVNFAVMMAESSGDPRHKELADAELQLQDLAILAGAHTRTQKKLASDIERNRKTIRANEIQARMLDAIATAARSCPPEQAGLFTATGEPIDADDVGEVLAELGSGALAQRKQARAARSAAEVERGVEPIGRAEQILTWHGMGLTFEVRATGWRKEALDAILRPHGRNSSQDTHRILLKVAYLSKGQHYRIVQGLDTLLATAGAEASRLREENAELQDRIEAAQRQLGKPFPRLAEMRAIEATRQRLSEELAAAEDSDDPEVVAARQKRQEENQAIVTMAKAAYLDPELRPALEEYLRKVAGPDDKIDAAPRPRLPAHIRALSAEIDAAELAALSQPESHTPTQRTKAAKRTAKPVLKPVAADPTDSITLADGTVLSPERGPDATTRIWVGRSESGVHIRVTRQTATRDEFDEPADPSWVYQLSRRSDPPKNLPVGAPWHPPTQWPIATALAAHLTAHLGAFTPWRACLPGELDIARAAHTELFQAARARQSTTTSGADATHAVLIDHTGTVLAEDRDHLAAAVARAARDGDAGSGPLRWRGVDFRIDHAPGDESNPNVVTGWYLTLNHAFRVPVPDGWLATGDERIAELLDYLVTHIEDLAEAQNTYIQNLTELIDRPTTAVDQLPERPFEAVLRTVAGPEQPAPSEPVPARLGQRHRSAARQDPQARQPAAPRHQPRPIGQHQTGPAEPVGPPADPRTRQPAAVDEHRSNAPEPASSTVSQPASRPSAPRSAEPDADRTTTASDATATPLAEPNAAEEQPTHGEESADAGDGMLFDVSPAAPSGEILTGNTRLNPAERALFEQAVAEAAAALEQTEAAGGHNPDAWLRFSTLTRTDPHDGQQYGATHPHWDDLSQWWIDAAVGELTSLGYQVIMVASGRTRRPVSVEVDEAHRTISLDPRGSISQHIWGTLQQVALARAALSTNPDGLHAGIPRGSQPVAAEHDSTPADAESAAAATLAPEGALAGPRLINQAGEPTEDDTRPAADRAESPEPESAAGELDLSELERTADELGLKIDRYHVGGTDYTCISEPSISDVPGLIFPPVVEGQPPFYDGGGRPDWTNPIYEMRNFRAKLADYVLIQPRPDVPDWTRRMARLIHYASYLHPVPDYVPELFALLVKAVTTAQAASPGPAEGGLFEDDPGFWLAQAEALVPRHLPGSGGPIVEAVSEHIRSLPAEVAPIGEKAPSPNTVDTARPADANPFGLTTEHPVIRHVRAAVERAAAVPDIVDAGAIDLVAIAALSDFVAAPDGGSLASVLRSLTRTANGTAELLIPRWLELRPPIEWPHWTRALNQAAQILRLTQRPILADRAAMVAELIAQRSRQAETTPAARIVRSGTAGIRLANASDPARPDLRSQLHRARNHHSIHERTFASTAMRLAHDALSAEREDRLEVYLAQLEAQPHPVWRRHSVITELTTLADVIEAAGYHQLINGVLAPPAVLRQVAARLATHIDEPPQPDQVIVPIPATVPETARELHPAEIVDPVQRVLRDLTDRARHSAMDTETAERSLSDATTAVHRSLATPDPQRLQLALDAAAADDRDLALTHLAWALDTATPVARGFSEADEIVAAILTRGHAPRIDPREWSRFMITYGDDSAPHLAVNLMAWSATLRAQTGRPGDLGELLRRVEITTVAEELDSIAHALALGHRFTLPEPFPVADQDALFEVGTIASTPTKPPAQPAADTTPASESERTLSDATEVRAPEPSRPALDSTDQNRTTMTENPPAPNTAANTVAISTAEPRRVRWETPEEQLAVHAGINAATARWFDTQLDNSPKAQEFLVQRLGSQDVVDRVRLRDGSDRGGLTIGYAPSEWRGLINHLRTLGYAEPDMIDAGVARTTRDGRIIDFFHNRLTFAVRDDHGRIAGFTGRDLDWEPGDERKYMNTRSTPLFDKGKLLLGLWEQRDQVGHAVPVIDEGPLDVAAQLAANLTDPDRPLLPVAACGTAVTARHLDVLDASVPAQRRHVFALDSDGPGRKRTRALGLDLLRRYPDFDILALPGNADPAEWALRVNPADQIATYLGEPYSKPALEFLAEAIRVEQAEWEPLDYIEPQRTVARKIAHLVAATISPLDRSLHAIAPVLDRLPLLEPADMPGFLADARRELEPTDPWDIAALAEALARATQDRTPDPAPFPLSPDRLQVEHQPPQTTADAEDVRLAQAEAEPDTTPEAQPTREAPTTSPPQAQDDAPNRVPTSPVEPPAVEGIGPWTRRIQITVTGKTTLVSGTDGGDPKVLRNTLKDNGFEWKPDLGNVWKHFYNRKRVHRDDAVQALRSLLADMDAQEAAKAAPARTFPPTPQQQAAIDAFREGKDIALRALAGTGKTSTLRMMAALAPDLKITYIAFNRAIADEAQAAFGKNVRADTMHAFARQALRNDPRYQRKLDDVAKNDGFPQEIMPLLGLDPDQDVHYGPDQGSSVSPESLIRMALGTVKRFRESADKQIGPKHVGKLGPDQAGLGAVILDYANRIWADKVAPTGALRFTHDDYLKIWALGDPVIPGDVVFFDEVQDVNELQAMLVQAQSMQTVVVGDTYQSIYGFRGARDFLTGWPADVTLPLTQSWRFGPRIAELGNHFLRLLRSRLVLEGNPGLDTVIERAIDDPDAVLCRTNAGAVAAVIDGMEAGKRVALVNGGNDLKDIARAAKDLKRGRRTRHPELSAFASWPDVQDYVRQHEDAQSLRAFVRLVDKYSPHGLIAMAADLVDERETNPDLAPELTVSTAHKAKGREWDRVRIAADFKAPEEDKNTGELVLPPAEDLRLAYVTVTRAKRALELGSLDWIVGWAERHDLARQTVQTTQDRDIARSPAAAGQPTPDPMPVAPAEPEHPVAAPAPPPAAQRPEPHAEIDHAIRRDRPLNVYPGEDWQTEHPDSLPDYDGHTETYRRGDTTLRLVRGLDEWIGDPVVMTAPWVILDRETAEVIDVGFHEVEVPFDTTDDLLDIFAEAGRHGWTELTDQGWLVTPAATARAARAAASAVPGRRLVQRDMEQGTWVSVPVDPATPGTAGAPEAAPHPDHGQPTASLPEETTEDQPAEIEDIDGAEVDQAAEGDEINEISEADAVEYDPVEDYGLTLVPGITDRSDLARWGWRQTDEQPGSEVGWTEVWDRDDWSLALTWTHDGQLVSPAYLMTSQLVLDENFVVAEGWTSWEHMEVAFTTAEEFRLIVEQAGRYGWVEPATRPGQWWLTGTPTAALALEAASSDPERRRVYLRNVDRADSGTETSAYWAFVDTREAVPILPRMPRLEFADAKAVERYVLGEHRRDREFVSLVKRVLSGRAYRGTTPQDAMADLAEKDPQTSQRAAAAAEGRLGRHFDVDRAQAALQRLLDNDPSQDAPNQDAPRSQPTGEPANTVEAEQGDSPELLLTPIRVDPPSTDRPTPSGPNIAGDNSRDTADELAPQPASTDRDVHPGSDPGTAAPSPIDPVPTTSTEAAVSRPSPARWNWQMIDRTFVDGDLIEQWRRGNWEIALPANPDGTVPDQVHFRHDVVLIDDRGQLVEDQTPWDAIAVQITFAQHLQDLLADVGLRGWVDPSTRPGHWRLTSAFSSDQIEEALRADSRRQAVVWRDDTWVFEATGLPVDLVRTPVLDLPNHRSVVRYVLGPNQGTAEPTTVVRQLISDARLALVPDSPERARLAEIDPELAERAVVAAIGGGAVPQESAFSARSAQHALQRLLDRDPTLVIPGQSAEPASAQPAEQHLFIRRLDDGGFEIEHQIVVDGAPVTVRFDTATDEPAARQRLVQFEEEADETARQFARQRSQAGSPSPGEHPLGTPASTSPPSDSSRARPPDTPDSGDEVVPAPGPPVTSVAEFPIRPAASDVDTAAGLQQWLHDRLSDLPREINGQSTWSTHLVLAIAASVLATGDDVQVAAIATRVAGNADDPGAIGRHLGAFADLLDELIPDAVEQAQRWGNFGPDTRLAEQIRAVATDIEWIAADPLALARARSTEFFRVVNPTAVLAARRAARDGDSSRIEGVFGGVMPPHLRGRLLDPAAIRLFVDIFGAHVARTDFDPVTRGTEMVATGADTSTVTTLIGLAAALRDRARADDRSGQALRESGAATIAATIETVAEQMALIGEIALPVLTEPPSARPEPAEADDDAFVEDDTDLEASAHPLEPADIALILRRIPGSQFAGLLRDPSPDHVQSILQDAPITRRRTDDEPWPGALEQIKLDTRGLIVEIDGVDPPRSDFVSWPRFANWIMTGAENAPSSHHLLLSADTTAAAFRHHEHGFLVLGQRQLSRDAHHELVSYRDTEQGLIIAAAQAAFESGNVRQRRRRRTLDDTAASLDGLVGMSERQQAVNERITTLATVLPTEASPRKRLSDVATGDVLAHPGYRGEPFRVTQPPAILPGRVELTGHLLDEGNRLAGPTIWPILTTTERDPQIPLTPIPGSLQELMTQHRPIPAELGPDEQASPPARPPAEPRRNGQAANPATGSLPGAAPDSPAPATDALPSRSARRAAHDTDTQIDLFGLDTFDQGTAAVDGRHSPEAPTRSAPHRAGHQPSEVIERQDVATDAATDARSADDVDAQVHVEHRSERRERSRPRGEHPGQHDSGPDGPVADRMADHVTGRPADEPNDDATELADLVDIAPIAATASQPDLSGPQPAAPLVDHNNLTPDREGTTLSEPDRPAQTVDADTAPDEVVRVSGDLLQPQHVVDQTVQRWTSLVASAADLGYAVHTGFTEDSRIDRQGQTISISFQQTAEQRLVDLAMAVVELAIDRYPLAEPPENWLPQPRTGEDQITRRSGDLDRELIDFSVPPLDGRVAGRLDLDSLIWETPIFAALTREMSNRRDSGDPRDTDAPAPSVPPTDVPRRAIHEPVAHSGALPGVSPHPQRTSVAGSRAPRSGLHAVGSAAWGLSAASDPLAAVRNRHNR